MFFIIGIYDREYDLNYKQMMTCPSCEGQSRIRVFIICRVFAFFFIPLAKWNKRYFVSFPCCQAVFELKEEVGRAIEKGQSVTINVSDLTSFKRAGIFIRKCSHCQYPADASFDYCPKCGQRL